MLSVLILLFAREVVGSDPKAPSEQAFGAGIYLQEADGGLYPIAERDPLLAKRLVESTPSLGGLPKGFDTHLYEYPNAVSGNNALKDFERAPRDVGPICEVPYQPLGPTLVCLRKLDSALQSGIEASIQAMESEAGVAGIDLRALLERVDSASEGWNRRGGEELAKLKCSGPATGRTAGDACDRLRMQLARYLALTDAWIRDQVILAALWETHRLPDGLLIDPDLAPKGGGGAGVPEQPASQDPIPYFMHFGPDEPARAGATPGSGGRDFPLNRCAAAYQAKSSRERMWTPTQVCRATEGTELAFFNEEIASYFVDSNALDYLRVLRMEAAARVLTGYRDATGENLEETPLACTPFEKGLGAVRNSAPSRAASHNREVFGSPKLRMSYLHELKVEADRIQAAQQKARTLAAVPPELCDATEVGGVAPPPCEPNPAYAAAQTGIRHQVAAIVDGYTRYPILAQGAGPLEHVVDSKTLANRFAEAKTDGELEAVFGDALRRLKRDASTVLTKVCGGDPREGGMSWQELVELHALAEPVLERFPQFRFVQWCAERLIAEDEDFKTRAKGFMTLGCLATMAHPAIFVWANPACSLTFTGIALADRKKSEKRLAWMSESQRMGIQVTDEADFKYARMQYEEAAGDVRSNLLWMPIDLGAWKIRRLNKLVPVLNPAQARRITFFVEKGGSKAARLHDFMDLEQSTGWTIFGDTHAPTPNGSPPNP